MQIPITYYLISIFLNLLIILFLHKISFHIGLIDIPGKRKMHQGNIPVIGGISIYLSLIPFIFLIDFHPWILSIILSSLVIVILGALDDSLQLGVTVRLISQLIASLIVIGSGLQIVDIGEYSILEAINLENFGILLTIISVLGLINAFNFIDGIDGLSSGLFFVAVSSLLLFSFLIGNVNNFDLLLLLLLFTSIFLFFNLGFIKNKKIFLGDSGSTLLGFIIAWLLIYYAHPEIRNIHPVLTLWCVTLPVFDLLAVVIRRLSKKINPLRPDRRHIHHLFLRKGYSQTVALIYILAFSIFSSAFGIAIFFIFGPLPCLLSYFIFFIFYLFFSIIFFRNKI